MDGGNPPPIYESQRLQVGVRAVGIGIGIGNVYYNCAVNNINGWVQICML